MSQFDETDDDAKKKTLERVTPRPSLTNHPTEPLALESDPDLMDEELRDAKFILAMILLVVILAGAFILAMVL